MNIKIAAIQLNNYTGQPQVALDYSYKLIKKVVNEGANFVVLPELSTCGYIPNTSIWDFAEETKGSTYKWATKIAKDLNIYLGAGFLECNGSDFFNAYLIAKPDGTAEVIRKIQPESYCFYPKDTGNIINTDIGKIGIGICVDSHKTWFAKRMIDEKPDILIMPHAWAMPYRTNKIVNKKDIIRTKEIVAEMCNQYIDYLGVPIVFVNSVGMVAPMPGWLGKLTPPDTYSLQGQSRICIPGKEPIVANSNTESYLIANANLGTIKMIASQEPKDYYGWLYKGSFIVRKIIIPRDIRVGKKNYIENINRVVKAKEFKKENE